MSTRRRAFSDDTLFRVKSNRRRKIFTEFSEDDFKKHKYRTWFFFENHPAGFRVKLQRHKLLCDCKKHKDRVTGICFQLYVCDCFDYTYKYKICQHIQMVDSHIFHPSFRISFKEMHALKEITLSDIVLMMEFCQNDTFPYKEYFKNHYNFNLKLYPNERKLYWDGFEHVLARHQLGRDKNLQMVERIIGKDSWEVTSKIEYPSRVTVMVDGVAELKIKMFTRNVKNVVNLVSDVCQLGCSAFRLCRVCKVCEHIYECTCMDYKCGFLCQHIHAVIVFKKNLYDEPYTLTNEPSFYRSARRNYFINMPNRVRHNAGIFMQSVVSEEGYEVSDLTESETLEPSSLVENEPKPCKSCNESEICPVCDICRHSIFCECEDFLNGFICSHLHAKKMLYLKALKDIENDDNEKHDEDEDEDDDETDENIEEILSPEIFIEILDEEVKKEYFKNSHVRSYSTSELYDEPGWRAERKKLFVTEWLQEPPSISESSSSTRHKSEQTETQTSHSKKIETQTSLAKPSRTAESSAKCKSEETGTATSDERPLTFESQSPLKHEFKKPDASISPAKSKSKQTEILRSEQRPLTFVSQSPLKHKSQPTKTSESPVKSSELESPAKYESKATRKLEFLSTQPSTSKSLTPVKHKSQEIETSMSSAASAIKDQSITFEPLTKTPSIQTKPIVEYTPRCYSESAAQRLEVTSSVGSDDNLGESFDSFGSIENDVFTLPMEQQSSSVNVETVCVKPMPEPLKTRKLSDPSRKRLMGETESSSSSTSLTPSCSKISLGSGKRPIKDDVFTFSTDEKSDDKETSKPDEMNQPGTSGDKRKRKDNNKK